MTPLLSRQSYYPIGVLDAALGIGFRAWAALVSLSRVALGVHYVLDVAGGAIVGIGVGLILAILM